uniref:Uncharacterized protein n=1 Tax=Oryzias latipes TaxID=8090 RepID=A0A3P9LS35_ORYLA
MSRHFLYNCSQPVLDVKIAFCQVTHSLPFALSTKLVCLHKHYNLLIINKDSIQLNGWEIIIWECF